MTVLGTDRTHPDVPTTGDRGYVPTPFLLVDVFAPAVVVSYLLLKYEPFDIIARPPGFVSSVMFPAVAFAILVVTPTSRLARIPVLWSVIAYVLWLTASRLWSVSPGNTEFMVRSELPALVLAACVAGTVSPRVMARVLVATFAAIISFSLVMSIVYPPAREVVFESGVEDPQQGFRGLFAHKNLLGIFAVFGLAIVLAFVRGAWRRVLIVLAVATIIGTRSATAGSGLFAITFLWFWLSAIGSRRNRRERAFVFVLSISSAVTAVLLALRLLPTLLGIYEKDLTFSGRTVIWSESWRLVAAQPLRGYGFWGLFGAEPPSLTGALQRRIGFEAAHAHNGVIGLLLDVGVVGAVLFALVLAQAIGLVVTVFRQTGGSAFGQWALMSVVALVVMSVSEPVFVGPNLGLLVIIMVILAHAVADHRRDIRYPAGTVRSQSLAWRVQSAGT